MITVIVGAGAVALAALGGVVGPNAPKLPAHPSARIAPSGCHTITVQTGTSKGAGTNGRVYIANHETARHSKSHWTELDHRGDLFERGAREDFSNQCGSFILDPKTGKNYITLGMSGNLYEWADPWQVTSVNVGTQTFTCGDQWVRPGQLLNCVAV